LVGTFFSIYVVPMAYSFIARDRQNRPSTDYTPFETEPGATLPAE